MMKRPDDHSLLHRISVHSNLSIWIAHFNYNCWSKSCGSVLMQLNCCVAFGVWIVRCRLWIMYIRIAISECHTNLLVFKCFTLQSATALTISIAFRSEFLCIAHCITYGCVEMCEVECVCVFACVSECEWLNCSKSKHKFRLFNWQIVDE